MTLFKGTPRKHDLHSSDRSEARWIPGDPGCDNNPVCDNSRGRDNKCGTKSLGRTRGGRKERGATAVEYALMVGLISVGLVASVGTLQKKMSYTLKNVVPSAIQFQPSDYGGYVNTPTVVGSYTSFKIVTQPEVYNYQTGVGAATIPTIERSGQLQWAIAACTPNGAPSMNMGVQSGGGDTNNLSLNLAVGSTYGWTKSASVHVTETNERPIVYLWIPSNTTGLEIRVKDLILGDPTANQQWINDHPYSGPC